MTDDNSATEKYRERLGHSVRDLPDQGRFSYAARGIKQRVGDLFFERGIETTRRQVELEHFHQERTHYGASDWLDLPRALRKCDIGPEDVFVDFGSGKGTDWPAYKASGLRTLWSFEEKFVRIIVECLPCILRLEGSVPTKDAKGLFVGRVIPIACEFEDLGAVLRLICRSARRLADEDYS